MSGSQKFTWEQLQRIENAVNFVLVSTGGPRALGSVVKDVLRTQDFMGTLRSGNKPSSSIGFLDLPAEIRNKIYRLCLVVGQAFPRSNLIEDDCEDDAIEFQKPQTQLFQLSRQIFAEAAPIYFAENKIVISHGHLPWSHDRSYYGSKPVSKVAHQNLRSLSITFDFRDGWVFPSELRESHSDGDQMHEEALWEVWCETLELLKLLNLRVLEVSLQNCYCGFCHRRLTSEIGTNCGPPFDSLHES
jgi:hypothetical protein